MKGYSAVDGTFTEHSGHTTTSFEDFLSSMGMSDEIEPTQSNQPNDQEDYNEEELGFSEEEFNELFDETEETDEDEFSGEESEDTDDFEEESYDFEMEDWDATITLPNGIEVSAQQLYEINNLSEAKAEMEAQVDEMKKKEMMLIENTNFSMQAIDSLGNQLIEIAKTRPLTESEQAQWNSLTHIKSYIDNATGRFKDLYSKQLQQQEQLYEETYNNNIETVFRKFPNIQEDVMEIKDYLSSKGMADPAGYLNSIKMDPMVIEILQDAITVSRMRKKIGTGSVKKVAKAVRGKKSSTSTPVNSHSPDAFTGVSSYDLPSYKQFINML